MKIIGPVFPTYYPPKTIRGLLDRVILVLNADLDNPIIGRHGRNLLKTAKKWKFDFPSRAEECPDCADCLFLSLLSASVSIGLHLIEMTK
jgi:hypothetical protein